MSWVKQSLLSCSLILIAHQLSSHLLQENDFDLLTHTACIDHDYMNLFSLFVIGLRH